MSQLAKAVMATDTGERKVITRGLSPLFTDVFSKKEEWYNHTSDDVYRAYRIEVKLGCKVLVSELDAIKSSTARGDAVIRTRRQIIEGVFGEFRPYIRQIEKAIYNHEYEEAGRLLYEMERTMFEDI